MTFSQSFEFGNSTFMKLESEANHAINDDEDIPTETHKALDVILESPTSKKPANKSIVRNRSRFLQNATQRTNSSTSYHRKFRRSKSDSTLPKAPQQKSNDTDNYSEFFRSDFSFQPDVTKEKPSNIESKDTSVLRVSQIEAAFKDDDVMVEAETNDTDNDDIIDEENSFDKPIFSEDLKDLLETEENDNMWQDSLPLSAIEKNEENVEEPLEILHEISNFICPPQNNDLLRDQLLSKELEISHRIFKETQQIQEQISERNISLSCMSPDQLKFTQEDSPLNSGALNDGNLAKDFEDNFKTQSANERMSGNTKDTARKEKILVDAKNNKVITPVSDKEMKPPENERISRNTMEEKIVPVSNINKDIKYVSDKEFKSSENVSEVSEKKKSVQVLTDNLEALKSISAWNLPLSVLKEYERKGVKKMFDWQIQCLSNPKVRKEIY